MIRVTVNDTTNTLSKRIIFGDNKNPQTEFNWRDLSKPVGADQYGYYREHFGEDYQFRVFDADGLPLYRDFVPGEVLPDGYSILPFFKGYECVYDKAAKGYISTYLNQTIGEGGRVYSVPGYYSWVWDGDISSQHPHSIISEVLFGPRYTKIFKEIVDARVAIKHRDFDTAGKLLNGALKPYLNEEYAADLAQALKIVINSIYGLTKAGFKNEFRDERNYDNIVAKRGALFMTLLKQEVEKRGAMVCHIKTDSIKIPNANQDVMDFVVKFGREFGYEFETEGIFVKFCLFNNAAYVAKTEDGKYITKADQFKEKKQPYLFKELFSKSEHAFKDFCETKSVSKGALYLDFNEELGEPVEPILDREQKKLDRMVKKAEKELKEKYPGISDAWICTKLYDLQTCEYPEVLKQNEIVKKLKDDIPNHHDYRFVGRVGQFTPVVEGVGGGVLLRIEDGKAYAASGTTNPETGRPYRWFESEHVKKYGLEDSIDFSFYRRLADKAIDSFNQFVDFDWFISDELPEKKPLIFRTDPDPDFINVPEGSPEELPWDP